MPLKMGMTFSVVDAVLVDGAPSFSRLLDRLLNHLFGKTARVVLAGVENQSVTFGAGAAEVLMTADLRRTQMVADDHEEGRHHEPSCVEITRHLTRVIVTEEARAGVTSWAVQIQTLYRLQMLTGRAADEVRPRCAVSPRQHRSADGRHA